MIDDQHLHRVLREWQIEPSFDSQFSTQVWRRIAAEEERGWAGLWMRLGDWLLVQLPRPAYASALLCAAAVIGLTSAALQANRAREQYREEHVRHYLQSIDPIAMAENAPAAKR